MSAYVAYFGGYLATETDMKIWLGSAKGQKTDVEFTAYAWPRGANSGAVSAITTFTKGGQFKKAVDAIQASGADKIYIVGHSSGCAIANAIDKSLKNKSNVVLVALDGFAPDPSQLARTSTQVWAAECEGSVSLNHDKLKERIGGRLQVYSAIDCKKELWALHFSVVNAAASDKTVKKVVNGYAQCRANLMWMSTIG